MKTLLRNPIQKARLKMFKVNGDQIGFVQLFVCLNPQVQFFVCNGKSNNEEKRIERTEKRNK